ncbi:MAG: alpha/beta fold hydrolase [Terracidiphilus sp.]|nr:alpha/beta fold hydrolase [Terracidiphilus sp.]
MSNSFFECDGTRLAYSDTGSGLPVVFLHPTPVDHRFWTPLTDRLAGVRSVAQDLRGHGTSELGSGLPVGGFDLVPDAPVLSVERLASDVLALLDQVHLESAVFAGCSIGGYVLLELWRRAPERIKGMAFICSKPQSDPAPVCERRAGTIAQVRAGKREELFDGMVRSSVGVSAQAARPEIGGELRSFMTLTDEALVATQAGLAVRTDSLPTLETVRVPLLVLAGGEDLAVAPADAQAFVGSAAPRVDYTFLANAGHFAAYEQPDTVAAVIRNWLELFA